MTKKDWDELFKAIDALKGDEKCLLERVGVFGFSIVKGRKKTPLSNAAGSKLLALLPLEKVEVKPKKNEEVTPQIFRYNRQAHLKLIQRKL